MRDDLKGADLRVAAYESLTPEQARAVLAAYVERGFVGANAALHQALVERDAALADIETSPVRIIWDVETDTYVVRVPGQRPICCTITDLENLKTEIEREEREISDLKRETSRCESIGSQHSWQTCNGSTYCTDCDALPTQLVD